ncbi:MAG: CRTAC1 family protein [Planctomycetes bacterium]|nr:CRTAC1 family protein [Planctomycetota bacterium]
MATLLALLACLTCCTHEDPAWFTDTTAAAGIRFEHCNGFTGRYIYPETVGGGIALFDYDNDGWLDIYLVNGNLLDGSSAPQHTNKLYRNNHDGTFTDVTARAGVGDTGIGQGCCAADYDGDGHVDLFVTNIGPDRLYHNNGDGTFTEVSAAAHIDSKLWGQTCAFFDFDGDGWLDLYVQNYVTYNPDSEHGSRGDYASPRTFAGAPDLLFRNNRDGTFTEVGKQAGISRPDGRGMGAVCADLDGDGDLDLFVANDAMENFYFVNQGNGTFRDESVRSGLAYDQNGASESSMGADVGDVDGDGKLDIVCPALRAEGCALYIRRENGFEERSRVARLAAATRPYTGFSPNLGDFDHDGDLDLFLCNGGVSENPGVGPAGDYVKRYGVRDQLLRNDGRGGFDAVGTAAGPHFQRELVGRGSAVGDLDNDGDLDLVLVNLRGKAVVLRNDGARGNWLMLNLRGKRGNREAVGAFVTLTVDGRTQVRTIAGCGGYLSQNDRRIHFGLGSATTAERVEIRWPDGKRQALTAVAANQILTVEQK